MYTLVYDTLKGTSELGYVFLSLMGSSYVLVIRDKFLTLHTEVYFILAAQCGPLQVPGCSFSTKT
jgi:hypothetical protein